MEDIGIFYGHLVYFTAIWSILLPFGLFYCHLVYFTAIWSILLPFGIHTLWPFGILMVIWYISPVLVYGTKENLANLRPRAKIYNVLVKTKIFYSTSKKRSSQLPTTLASW
jgi:hypothetical protein